jgi:hypothetical protein
MPAARADGSGACAVQRSVAGSQDQTPVLPPAVAPKPPTAHTFPASPTVPTWSSAAGSGAAVRQRPVVVSSTRCVVEWG